MSSTSEITKLEPVVRQIMQKTATRRLLEIETRVRQLELDNAELRTAVTALSEKNKDITDDLAILHEHLTILRGRI